MEAIYIRGMAHTLHQAGWDVMGWNYRSCGGIENRLMRSYHSGESDDLRHVIVTDAVAGSASAGAMVSAPLALVNWSDLLASPPQPGHRVIDTDMVAILYTSGSTGKPKGVVLSHRNMVAGAKSVASYLENGAQDPTAIAVGWMRPESL